MNNVHKSPLTARREPSRTPNRAWAARSSTGLVTPLALIGLIAAFGAPSPAIAAAPAPLEPEAAEAELERAARCLRRAELACAEHHARRVAGDQAASLELKREALAIAVSAIARADAADADARASAACGELLAIWPNYAPPPDADARIARACEQARRVALERGLPRTIDAGPPPRPPPSEILPAPLIYRPSALAELPPEERRFSVSLGVGVAVPVGAPADRFEAGVQAAIDLRVALGDGLSLWASASLALLRLSATLPVEPYQGTSLTSYQAVLGLELSLPLIERLELVGAVGAGFGGFGLSSADEALGFAVAPVIGARYQAVENLAVRVDLAPAIVIPLQAGIGVGGHLAVLLRGEASF